MRVHIHVCVHRRALGVHTAADEPMQALSATHTTPPLPVPACRHACRRGHGFFVLGETVEEVEESFETILTAATAATATAAAVAAGGGAAAAAAESGLGAAS